MLKGVDQASDAARGDGNIAAKSSSRTGLTSNYSYGRKEC